MKIELKEPTKRTSPDLYYYELYISKTEFIKNYETHKKKSLYQFSQIVYMFTCPQCFSMDISEEFFDKIYETLKSKTTIKGITLCISGDKEEPLKFYIEKKRYNVTPM